jgi:hypothetical protein
VWAQILNVCPPATDAADGATGPTEESPSKRIDRVGSDVSGHAVSAPKKSKKIVLPCLLELLEQA